MTILELIEQANTTADIRQFRFARIDEVNAFMDSFTFNSYPCHVVEPFTTSVTWLNGRTKTAVQINGWVLKRIPQDTVNFKTKEVEELHLSPMREKCKAFVKALLHSDDAEDMIDPEVDQITASIKPEYGFLSAHLFGVSYQLTLPVRENIC